MKRKVTDLPPLSNRIYRQRRWQLLQKLTFGFCLLLSSWLVFNTITLMNASSKSVDATFVLGGSIRREIYAASLAKENPQIPILISAGSQDPCIIRIFQRQGLAFENVWHEKCANSTFGNFYYGLPILKEWRVRKVRLITSQSHLPRAQWMAQIILGSHGIWVELDIAKEQGIPGNSESLFKTGVDVLRSLAWAFLSHITQPQCPDIIKLSDVDLNVWQQQGFKCEHQGE